MTAPRGTAAAPGGPDASGVPEVSASAASASAVEPARERGGFIARAAAVTAALTAAGALAGLVRDQTLAHLFGAGAATDAFLVSWTLPEVAATLLIEDAMALVLVPAFSLALSRRAATAVSATPATERPTGPAAYEDPSAVPDPVRALLAATLPRLLLVLGCLAALLAAGAPLLVDLLAPGLPERGTAVDCTRLTALTVLTFGTAGYFSAALRAHRRFVPPAAIYTAYNVGIVATVCVLHTAWGVRAAAAGVALGGALMVLVQLPAFLRALPVRNASARAESGNHDGLARGEGEKNVPAHPADALSAAGAVVVPVVLFALTRQAQVLVERFLASSLPAGAISHLNYAQKVAQIPMVLSLMLCTVTFPVVARALADGEPERARSRVRRDLTLAALVVLLGAAYVVAYAPQIVELLFQRGAFTAADTAATASVMRVYALGLLGHSLVGALVRPYFSAGRPTWYPAGAMAAGLLVTVVAGALTAGPWGVYGIAAANAAGITLTAGLLLRALDATPDHAPARASRDGHGPVRRARYARSPLPVPVGLGTVLPTLARLLLATAVAATAGWAVAPLCGAALPSAAAGALVVPAVFGVTAFAAGVPEVPQLLSTATRRFRHDR
ncbi:lipid II flippase MurJ [Streptomyces sp. Z26]|uniref:lipid II flippase MurJ n=1 Tax=Streptomyces sp. Z26 TaxID=2500177 RepID=UPI0019D28560|nr:lipid II flippase MurJ [Streptomyces sp. Z26]